MKKNILIFVSVLVTIPIVFISFVYYKYEPYSAGSLWYQRFYMQKRMIAENNKQKIVFVGGSSTLYGIKTSELEKDLNVPVINYAVAHGLRTDYILYDVKNILNAGDVVILPLEYTLINYNGKQNDEMINYIMSFDRKYFYSLDFNKKCEIISKIGPINILESIVNKSNFTIDKLKTNKLNKNGDIKNNTGNKKIKYGLKVVRFKFKITDGMQSINSFKSWCQKNNVNLFISYASLLNVKNYDNLLYKNFFNDIHTYFKRHYNVLGSPNDFFYEKKYIYNTRYHLNNDGRNIRTKQYLNYLKTRIQVKNINIKIKDLIWALKGNSNKNSSSINFSFNENTKSHLITTDLLTKISPLNLTITLETKTPTKLISISLYNEKDEYAHFFFKQEKYTPGIKKMFLSPQNIKQQSNNFKFENIKKISIRIYPVKDLNSSFELKSIKYTKGFNVI